MFLLGEFPFDGKFPTTGGDFKIEEASVALEKFDARRRGK